MLHTSNTFLETWITCYNPFRSKSLSATSFTHQKVVLNYFYYTKFKDQIRQSKACITSTLNPDLALDTIRKSDHVIWIIHHYKLKYEILSKACLSEYKQKPKNIEFTVPVTTRY